jgi:hypothetical protein
LLAILEKVYKYDYKNLYSMKKQIIVSTIMLTGALAAFAQEGSVKSQVEVRMLGGEQKIRQAVTSLEGKAGMPLQMMEMRSTGDATKDAKVKALQQEMEAKVKAIHEEYKAKIDAIVGVRKDDDKRASSTRPVMKSPYGNPMMVRGSSTMPRGTSTAPGKTGVMPGRPMMERADERRDERKEQESAPRATSEGEAKGFFSRFFGR